MKTFFFLLTVFCFTFGKYQHFSFQRGTKTQYGTGNFGEEGVFNSTNQIPGFYFPFTALIYPKNGIEKKPEIFVLCPYVNFGYSDQVWKYSPSKNQWSFLKGRKVGNQNSVYSQISTFESSNLIGTRGYTSGWTTKDEKGDIITIFGGTSQSPIRYGPTNEIWQFNTSSNSFAIDYYEPGTQLYSKYTTKGEYEVGNTASGRYYHQCVEINENEVLCVGGYGYLQTGYTGYLSLSDYWIYSKALKMWKFMGGDINHATYKQIQMTLNKEYHADNKIGSIYLGNLILINEEEAMYFGGYSVRPPQTYSVQSNCINKYNITSNMWKFVSGEEQGIYQNLYAKGYLREYSDENLIGATSYGAAYKINDDEILFFGGNGFTLATQGALNSEWRFNIKTNQWKFTGKESSKYPNRYASISSSSYPVENMIGACYGFASAYLEEEKEIFIAGGYGYSEFTNGYIDDVWRLYLGNTCNDIEDIDPSVCSYNGTCVGFDQCICEEGYFGSYCELTKCYSVLSNESNVCSGNGICFEGKCTCIDNSIYVREDCSIDGTLEDIVNNLWIYIAIPIAIAITFVLFVVLIVVFITFIGKLKKDLKKFNEIEDIEIVLEEQKLARDSSVAHFNINKKLFEIDPKDIKIEKKIGSGGSSAVVYLAIWNNQKVAYKCFMVNDFLETEKYKEFEKEVEILASISFPFILTFYGATLNKSRLGFVMEYAENGDIECFLKKYKLLNKEQYSIHEKYRMLYEISSAMLYLHNKSIMHRDLKLNNVLVDNKEATKLMDFGLSKMVEDEKTRTKKVGTSFFIAPEVMEGHYSFPCDVYSFAMMMYVMLSENFSPFGVTNNLAISLKVMNNPNFRPDMDTLSKVNISKEIKDMIFRNWSHDPKERMNFEEISSFLRKILENSKSRKSGDDKKNGESISIDSSEEMKELKMTIEGLKKQLEGYKGMKNKLSKLEIENQRLLKRLNQEKKGGRSDIKRINKIAPKRPNSMIIRRTKTLTKEIPKSKLFAVPPVPLQRPNSIKSGTLYQKKTIISERTKKAPVVPPK